MDDGEQVLAWQVQGLRRLQRWSRGHTSHHALREVTLGRLPDGRWLVEHSDVRVPSMAYRTEQRARDVVAGLTADGQWVEQPAVFGGAQNPVGGGWRRTGGAWIRDPGSGQAADDR